MPEEFNRYNADDELCVCGHLKSQHGISLQSGSTGHGPCAACECEKYTWKCFLWLRFAIVLVDSTNTVRAIPAK